MRRPVVLEYSTFLTERDDGIKVQNVVISLSCLYFSSTIDQRQKSGIQITGRVLLVEKMSEILSKLGLQMSCFVTLLIQFYPLWKRIVIH